MNTGKISDKKGLPASATSLQKGIFAMNAFTVSTARAEIMLLIIASVFGHLTISESGRTLSVTAPLKTCVHLPKILCKSAIMLRHD